MNIDIFDNFDNCENDNCENDNWENEFYNNELYNLIKRCITFFFMINTFYHMMVMLYYYFDVEPFATYLYNDTTKFITNLQNGLSEKLLKYNGHFSDFDNDSSDSSDSSDSESSDSIVPEIKYEDKYLDDIKMMSMDYRFSWVEIAIRDNKFNELFDLYKTNLLNNLERKIVEKSMKYIEIDDDYENIEIETLNGVETLGKEEMKKKAEAEIILLRSKVKDLDKELDDDLIYKLKLEARNFVIKERLDGLKNNFVFEKTPLGNVIMYWNNSRESFEYYSDNTIPYRYLETIGRKYVKTFNCRQIYVDMEFELMEFERKQKEKLDLEEKEKMELEQNTSFNSNLVKKNVFAKFKNYNKESGTGKVNRGAAPPKNSIPNNNSVKKADEKTILKENANRYTCEGKIANFSFLKKPDRKVIDKKYAMTFADYKKLNL